MCLVFWQSQNQNIYFVNKNSLFCFCPSIAIIRKSFILIPIPDCYRPLDMQHTLALKSLRAELLITC